MIAFAVGIGGRENKGRGGRSNTKEMLMSMPGSIGRDRRQAFKDTQK